MGSLPWVFIARPPQVRMVLRTSLGVIIVLTLLVISQGSIPKTNTGREVTGDDLNVGDINLASIGHTGMRARVKRNSGNNAEKKKSKKRKKIIKRQRRFNQKKSAKKAGNKKNKKTQTERKQQKRLSRRLRKKKGKKTNGNRRKKEKKEKRLRRNKKRNRKHKNNKNHKLGRQEGICQNLTCLNSLVLTLKLEKDTVRNFLAQEKRIKSKMNLMKSKQNKSTKYDQTALELETRLGNTGNHSSLGPLCLGEYNTTTGRKASEVAHSLEDCNSTIVDACKMHSIVTEENQETLKTCKAKMFEYKEKSTKCQEEPSNCDCWSELEEMVSAIKKCNVAKNIEKGLNDDYKNCKKVYINCSQTEDKALEYMINCYTSEARVKRNIKELLAMKDSANKLITNQEVIVSTSETKSGRWKRFALDSINERELSRQKRQKIEESITCATYIEEIEQVDALFALASLIGNGNSIVTQTLVIVKQTVQVCTTEQVTVIKAHIVQLQAAIVRIVQLIAVYQQVLETLTGTTVAESSLEVTITLPPGYEQGVVTEAVTAETEAPQTEAPTTEAPSTEGPTEARTTEVPTEAPITEGPSTEAPTTQGPSTEGPTTEAPTTEAPTTEIPTEAPTTEGPTEAPTTEGPSTEAPTTQGPSTEGPTREEPTTEGPATTVPSLTSESPEPITSPASTPGEEGYCSISLAPCSPCTSGSDERKNRRVKRQEPTPPPSGIEPYLLSSVSGVEPYKLSSIGSSTASPPTTTTGFFQFGTTPILLTQASTPTPQCGDCMCGSPPTVVTTPTPSPSTGTFTPFLKSSTTPSPELNTTGVVTTLELGYMPYRLDAPTSASPPRMVQTDEELSPLEEEEEGSSWIRSLRTLLRSLS